MLTRQKLNLLVLEKHEKNMAPTITIENQVFKRVDQFRYLESTITHSNSDNKITPIINSNLINQR